MQRFVRSVALVGFLMLATVVAEAQIDAMASVKPR